MDDVPSLKDLCGYITPRYAGDWKIIGKLIGLPFSTLRVIEEKNPSDDKWCCDQILKRWQEISNPASWKKLFAAIDSPASFNNCHSISKGSRLIVYIKLEIKLLNASLPFCDLYISKKSISDLKSTWRAKVSI